MNPIELNSGFIFWFPDELPDKNYIFLNLVEVIRVGLRRCFAEFILSETEGLRMTTLYYYFSTIL